MMHIGHIFGAGKNEKLSNYKIEGVTFIYKNYLKHIWDTPIDKTYVCFIYGHPQTNFLIFFFFLSWEVFLHLIYVLCKGTQKMNQCIWFAFSILKR